MVSQFSHTNIVTLYDAIEHEGGHYLVLEYVEGSPIQGPMTEADAVRLALQIAAALGG